MDPRSAKCGRGGAGGSFSSVASTLRQLILHLQHGKPFIFRVTTMRQSQIEYNARDGTEDDDITRRSAEDM